MTNQTLGEKVESRQLLPEPNYTVVLRAEKGKHFYDVTQKDGSVLTFNGTTSQTKIIDKPALVGWAGKIAALTAAYRLAMRKGVFKDVTEGEAWYQQVSAISGKGSWVNTAKAFNDLDFKPKSIKLTPDLLADIFSAGVAAPNDKKTTAGDVGTLVHGLIDQWVKTGAYDDSKLTDPVKLAINEFQLWYSKQKFIIIGSEIPVASLKYKVGGMLDALAMSLGEIILLDWKTSNFCGNEFALQVSSYAVQFAETYGVKVNKMFIVQIPKTVAAYELAAKDKKPAIHVYKISQPAMSFEAFLTAKNLTNLMGMEHLEEVI